MPPYHVLRRANRDRDGNSPVTTFARVAYQHMKKSIEIRSVTCLRGPNMWTYRPVLEARVDIGELEDFPSNTIPGFYDRLVAWVPTLSEHRCSYGEPGGFLKRLQEGTWPGHILEHVTLELQNLAGMPGGFGRARETSARGVYKVVVRAWNETVTEAALHAARDLVMAAIDGGTFDVAAAVDGLRQLVDDHCLGPSTAAIVNAAEDRHIPTIRLSEGNLVQLGHGASQHRIWTAETDLTSAIAQGISRDKDLSRGLLKSCGVPVPNGRLVSSADDAWAAAEELGLPVVIKPNDASHGVAVFTNLTTREDIELAYAGARAESSGVIVEEFVAGHEHRMLVIGGRMIAAASGQPATVRGDGTSTIGELIERDLNSDPRRGASHTCPLNPVPLDAVVRHELLRQGYSPESVPAAGAPVLIRRHGNVALDVTDAVHPSVAAAAALAARVVGLDIAGVDLVAQDVTRPLAEQQGAVVAVNSGPGLLLHLKPEVGIRRPVGQAVVGHLFPEGDSGRIPIIGITGTSGTTMIARLVSRLIQLSGQRVGLACADGLFLDRRQVQKGDCANWESAHRLLTNRCVEAAVCENGGHSMVAEGLAYDRCQIAVLTDLDPTARIDEFDIQTPEQMYNVLRTQVDVVLPSGAAVLNAHDPLVVQMASLCDGEVIFFATDPDNEVIAKHRAAGARTVVARDSRIVFGTGSTDTSLKGLDLTAANSAALSAGQILAAAGVAWALGISPDLIRAGIETFDPGESVAAGHGTH